MFRKLSVVEPAKAFVSPTILREIVLIFLPKTELINAIIGAVTTKIKAKLAKGDSIKSLAKVSVDTVNNGDVTLTGTAESDKAISKAEMIAKHTTGVKHVNNKIELKKDD